MFDAIMVVPSYSSNEELGEKKVKAIAELTAGIREFAKDNQLDFFTSYGVSSHLYERYLNSSKRVLFIALGGDGTTLTAMREAALISNGYVIGINFGKVGFLTEFSGDEEVPIQKVLNSVFFELDQWIYDSRMTVNCTLPNDNDRPLNAVNEILITTSTRRNPLEYDIYINDSFVAKQFGDGVMVSTATGSTAYAMSAGGTIMSPTSRAMQIVPLAPHTLTSRPVIVSEHDTVRIHVPPTQRATVVDVIADGGVGYTNNEAFIEPGLDFVMANGPAVNLLRPKDWNFFNVLSSKMGWGK